MSTSAVVDEALRVAGRLMPGSGRIERLEALAQEFLGGFPVAPDADVEPTRALGFQPASSGDEDRRARAETDTDRWSALEAVVEIPMPDVEYPATATAFEIDRTLEDLAAARRDWAEQVGYWAHG